MWIAIYCHSKRMAVVYDTEMQVLSKIAPGCESCVLTHVDYRSFAPLNLDQAEIHQYLLGLAPEVTLAADIQPFYLPSTESAADLWTWMWLEHRLRQIKQEIIPLETICWGGPLGHTSCDSVNMQNIHLVCLVLCAKSL